ncbi:MAG: hypothetical protein ACE5PO_00500 [Candidatus Bathyarchaeia archaeon]
MQTVWTDNDLALKHIRRQAYRLEIVVFPVVALAVLGLVPVEAVDSV